MERVIFDSAHCSSIPLSLVPVPYFEPQMYYASIYILAVINKWVGKPSIMSQRAEREKIHSQLHYFMMLSKRAHNSHNYFYELH